MQIQGYPFFLRRLAGLLLCYQHEMGGTSKDFPKAPIKTNIFLWKEPPSHPNRYSCRSGKTLPDHKRLSLIAEKAF